MDCEDYHMDDDLNRLLSVKVINAKENYLGRRDRMFGIYNLLPWYLKASVAINDERNAAELSSAQLSRSLREFVVLILSHGWGGQVRAATHIRLYVKFRYRYGCRTGAFCSRWFPMLPNRATGASSET